MLVEKEPPDRVGRRAIRAVRQPDRAGRLPEGFRERAGEGGRKPGISRSGTHGLQTEGQEWQEYTENMLRHFKK